MTRKNPQAPPSTISLKPRERTYRCLCVNGFAAFSAKWVPASRPNPEPITEGEQKLPTPKARTPNRDCYLFVAIRASGRPEQPVLRCHGAGGSGGAFPSICEWRPCPVPGHAQMRLQGAEAAVRDAAAVLVLLGQHPGEGERHLREAGLGQQRGDALHVVAAERLHQRDALAQRVVPGGQRQAGPGEWALRSWPGNRTSQAAGSR